VVSALLDDLARLHHYRTTSASRMVECEGLVPIPGMGI
jgi:hypothetical protein